MMRIKEAIQRRKLIQQLNDDYNHEDEQNELALPFGRRLPSACIDGIGSLDNFGAPEEDFTPEELRLKRLKVFVNDLNRKLSYPQRRALRVTWKRLCEAPKTSGRGNLQIMEKIYMKLLEKEPHMTSVFYRSAFVKCIEDRRRRCVGKSIATLRDHAHLLIDFIDSVLNVMFDEPLTKPVFDPISLGQTHAKLTPLGFHREVWLKLGECFAEVMFSQDCVRAYPHAASAWSMLAVTVTDKMYSHGAYKEEMMRASTTSLSLASTTSTQPRTCKGRTVNSSCPSLDRLDDDDDDDDDEDCCPGPPPNTQRRAVSSAGILATIDSPRSFGRRLPKCPYMSRA